MNPRDEERGLERAADGNRFAFAAMVAKRADQIDRGSPPRAYVRSMKPVSLAVAEAARGETWVKRT